MSVPGVINFPASLDDQVSLIEAANDAYTTLTAQLSPGDNVAHVADTSLFGNSGFWVCESEIGTYNGKTPTQLLNLTHSEQNTSSAIHASGATIAVLVTARDHNVLADVIRAIQSKVGIGTGSPSLGKTLRGTSGGSSWQDRTYRHVQGASATTWTINHNLGCRPAVTAVDSAGTVVNGRIEYVNDNTLTLSFSTAFNGEAYLN